MNVLQAGSEGEEEGVWSLVVICRPTGRRGLSGGIRCQGDAVVLLLLLHVG